MNNKSKTSIIASVIATLIITSIFATTNNLASAASVVDNTDYFAQARVVFDEIQGLESKINADGEKIASMTDQFAKASSGTVEKVNLERQIKDLQTLTDVRTKRIADLHGELDRLEKLNVAAFKVDDITRQKFQTTERAIIDRYLDENSVNYVGSNPVEEVYAHTKNRSIVIILDPQELTEKKINIDSMKATFANIIKTAVGEEIPIEIQFGKFVDLGCAARDNPCRPLLGGLTVSKKNVNTLNTMGYKASKTGEGTGFVIAGHTAENLDAEIVQPHNDNTKRVGTVRAYSNTVSCDCAYVKVDAGITVDNTIYKSSNLVYTVTGKTADSSQTVGTWVYKSGARTAVTLGQITGNVAGNSYNAVDIYHGQGDSGAPVFATVSGDNVSLYGMFYRGTYAEPPGLGPAKYHPWDQIQSQIGAVPP
ncbi:MAG: hypothetical protein HZA84_04430 [Thaumarchaeota archaeon]|nr:hypothetical protein [Nitrososphaerota archaeon]